MLFNCYHATNDELGLGKVIQFIQGENLFLVLWENEPTPLFESPDVIQWTDDELEDDTLSEFKIETVQLLEKIGTLVSQNQNVPRDEVMNVITEFVSTHYNLESDEDETDEVEDYESEEVVAIEDEEINANLVDPNIIEPKIVAQETGAQPVS